MVLMEQDGIHTILGIVGTETNEKDLQNGERAQRERMTNVPQEILRNHFEKLESHSIYLPSTDNL